jgi:hypothetical protein
LFSICFIFGLMAPSNCLFNTGSIPYEYNKTLDYLRYSYESNSNILIISERPNLYIVHYKGALDFKYANKTAELIKDKVRQRI